MVAIASHSLAEKNKTSKKQKKTNKQTNNKTKQI